MAGRMFRDLGRDLRHAARLLAREPGYTAVALLGIAVLGLRHLLFQRLSARPRVRLQIRSAPA